MSAIELALESILPAVSKPTRYLGNELHAVVKDWSSARVRVALVFPEVYEIGMSTLGMKILYDVVNRRDDALAERAYQPWLDMAGRMRESGVPLFALESKRPIRDFDLVGFSLQAEQTFTGVLECLDLAGIPLLATERGPGDPLVAAGGPCMANPEPLADFIDFFLIGDGEEALGAIVEALKQAKHAGWTRLEILRSLCSIRGVYVPAFYDVRYDEAGKIVSVTPNDPAAPSKVERTWIDDLESAPFPENPIVPLQEVTQDRLAIEVLRGCTQGCRFCQAGYYYRPVRERSPERVREIADRGVRAGGYDDVSLVSLSTADHSEVNRLAHTVNEALKDRRVAISLPSLRIEKFSVHLAETVREVKKTGFTFAPEAGTWRMRKVINKPIPEETILKAAEAAFSRGWNLIKMYFMIGLPTETDEDVEGIAELSDKILAVGRRVGRGKHINVSVGSFVPKSFTPFQWEPMAGLDDLRRKIATLKRRVSHGGAKLKWHDPECSIVEALLSRGDRTVGRAIRRAWELGARFDGWSEHFSFDRWVRACEETGVDLAFHLRRRDLDEVLPWDHIDVGIFKKFLVREYKKSLGETVTDDCRWGQCFACGVPGAGKDIVLTGIADSVPYGNGNGSGHHEAGADPHAPPKDPRSTSARLPGDRIKVRVRYAKGKEVRYLSHLDVSRAFERALRGSDLPVAYTEGFSPRVRLSFGPPLPVGVMGTEEVLDVELRERTGLRRLAATLNDRLPPGLRVGEVEYVPFLTPSVSAVPSAAVYVAEPSPTLPLSVEHVSASIEAFRARDEFRVSRTTPKGVKTADLKSALVRISAESDGERVCVFLTLRTDRAGIAPRAALAALLGLTEQESHLLRIARVSLRPLQQDAPKLEAAG